MLNTGGFVERLSYLLKYYDLSASGFADKIKVQRSSISHLLSGRNKPSLDFVLKVTDTFPEVDLYWLLKGKGSFPSKPPKPSPAPKDLTKIPKPQKEKNIEKIIIFYSDGSFKSYQGE